MDGRDENMDRPLDCAECRDGLQDYLDGTLPKTRSVEVFLHLRACPDCARAHERLQTLFGLLGSLPVQEVPAGFDDPIMASIPLAAYRAMEPLRRARLPVILEQESLPAPVRAPGVRIAGLAVAVLAAASVALGGAPGWMLAVAGAGAVPELLVRLQDLARRAVLAARRSEG